MERVKKFNDLKAIDINGKKVQFSSLRNKKAILIINVASNCEKASAHYAELNRFYHTYKNEGFEILAFPCNQFGCKEPVSNYEIKELAKKYDVEFKLFSKIDVNGAETHPAYGFLRKNSLLFNYALGEVEEIPGNFAKFLVNSDGTHIQYFDPKTSPEELEKAIQTLLAENL